MRRLGAGRRGGEEWEVPPRVAEAAQTWKRKVESIDRPTRVLLRDFAIFEVKLLLDAAKGIVVSQAALVALGLDLVFNRTRGRPAHWFYLVLDCGEWMDRWLDLYGASSGAEDDPEGLFGRSVAGAPTLLGQLERLADEIFATRNAAVVPEGAGETAADAEPATSAEGEVAGMWVPDPPRNVTPAAPAPAAEAGGVTGEGA